MRESKKFFQRGLNFENTFSYSVDPNTTKIGPSSARQQNAI